MNLVQFRTFFLGVVSFSFVVFLLFQISGVDLNRHNKILEHIRYIKELEVRQNQQVLQLRLGLINHYDTLVMMSKETGHELSKLESLGFADIVKDSDVISKYKEIHLKREQLIQDFSAENAQLNNSLYAFPKQASSVFDKKVKRNIPVVLEEQLNALLQKVLLYVVDSDFDKREAVKSLVKDVETVLSKRSLESNQEISTLLIHAKVILNQKPIVDDYVQRFIRVPAIETIDRINDAYLSSYQKRIAQARIFRYILFGACLFLFGGIVYVVFQLRKSSQNMRNIIAQNADAISVINRNGKILFVNLAAESLFGRSAKNLMDQDFGYPVLQGKTTEIHILSTDGRPKLAEMRVVSTSWRGEDVNLATLRDVTERKALEEQLLQSQKMESIGHLAGGIAHDFNNFLTVIKGYAEFLLEDLEKEGASYRRVDEIYNATKRASNLTRQLLAFSRNEVVRPKVFDLNKLVLDMEKMLARLIGEDVELVTNPSNNLGFVKIDPGQMEQVLLNLAVNARDAMPSSGGKLTIETANFQLDQKYTQMHPDIKPGEYILLSVSDNGTGIPNEVKNKIFEPFFTTKEEGKGTGLGLSTCYGIIKQAGGNIQVYSETNQGTTFRIYLPRCHEPVDQLICEKRTDSLPRGDETILFVEDESSVRKFAVTVLRNQGYQVFEATNGAEALRIAEAQGKNALHLLITDVVMPQMNGGELMEHMRRLREDLKVLFISGYTDDTVVRHGVLEDKVDFLQKPFGASALAFKVKEVLDR